MNGLARALLTIGLAASPCALLAAPAGAVAPAPTTILSFSGTSTGSGYTRTLQFDTPEDGRYVLRASTAGGTINVNFGGNGCCYRPIGPTLTDYDLGGLGPYTGWHVQIAGSGAATDYSGAILELPHLLTSGDKGTTYAGPGGYQFHYTLAEPAYVEPRLWDEQTRQYRDFPGATLPAGSYTFNWDLRDSSGTQVPDGRYSVSVHATFDSAPDETIGQYVEVDTRPPTITLAPLPAQNHDTHLAYFTCCLVPYLAVGTGQAKVTLSVDGGPAQQRPMALGGGWDEYIPRGGWPLGPHRAVITATDFAGNSARAEANFTVTMPPHLPHPNWFSAHCGTLELKAAVRGSKLLNRSLRRVAHAPRGDLFRTWLIKQRRCVDLSGGLVDELAVVLREQHGSKTVLAVFTRARGAWSLKFQDTKHQVDSISPDGRDLDVDLASGNTLSVHWNGHRFVLRRAD